METGHSGVLAHTNCGAVQAAILGKEPGGQITALYPHIQPAIPLPPTTPNPFPVGVVSVVSDCPSPFSTRTRRRASLLVIGEGEEVKMEKEGGWEITDFTDSTDRARRRRRVGRR